MTKYEELKEYLRTLAPRGVALAYSGGVDSSLLLAVLTELHKKKPFPLIALTMHSIFQREEELSEVQNAAKKSGVELKLFSCDPLSIPEIKYNPPDRCYWCKRYIFSEFRDCATSKGLATLIDGTNADDRKCYRPGLAALTEMRVLSPLAELGITKAKVRKMAAFLKLECAVKPSTPCMATRFEYGTLLTKELIQKAIDGEDVVRKFLPSAADVRLRIHAGIARIEVETEWMPVILDNRVKIAEALKKLGFQFVTLDLAGFHSGCFDQPNQQTTEV